MSSSECHPSFLLLLLLLSVSQSHGGIAPEKTEISAEDEAELQAVKWMDWKQVRAAYIVEYNRVKQLGNFENRNDVSFYPESRVLVNSIVTIFCLLSPDRSNGYRTNSVTLQILEVGQIHRRSLLAPRRKLQTQADQLNCWSYAQESVCQPLRDCNSPARPQLRSVGIITKEGYGIFQIKASQLLEAHYQCVTEAQSILSSQELADRQLKDFTSTASNVHWLEVFGTNIGFPKLMLDTYPRGQPLHANCSIVNSNPGSEFILNLLLLRPPPPGTPGESREELLATHSVRKGNAADVLVWRGELALKSHHGLGLLCRVTGDWGRDKGRRVARSHLRISYMFPAFVSNPRILQGMAPERIKYFQTSYYKTPKQFDLHRAEYAVCKSDGYPPPLVNWSVKQPKIVWILNETMFITKLARIGQKFKAICSANSSDFVMSDQVEVEITVLTASHPLPSKISSGLLHASLWYLLQAIGMKLAH